MCWNEHVSINTFIFSCFVITLTAYNNEYTPYKIHGMNIYTYIFAFSVIFMQLIEFFLWRNIDNVFYNSLFSIIGILLICFQPIASILLIENNPSLIQSFILAYLLALGFGFSQISFNKIPITKIVDGHLRWKWINLTNFYIFIFMMLCYVFFLFFPILYNCLQQTTIINNWFFIFIFAFSTYLYTLYSFVKKGYSYSLWCWFINIISIYVAFKILIYLPYVEKMELC